MRDVEKMLPDRIKMDWTLGKHGILQPGTTAASMKTAVASKLLHILPSVSDKQAHDFAQSLLTYLAGEHRYVPQKVELASLVGKELTRQEWLPLGSKLRLLKIRASNKPKSAVPPNEREKYLLMTVVKDVLERASFSRDLKILASVAFVITELLARDYGLNKATVHKLKLATLDPLQGTFDWNGASWCFLEETSLSSS